MVMEIAAAAYYFLVVIPEEAISTPFSLKPSHHHWTHAVNSNSAVFVGVAGWLQRF